jgi:NitT/TauT family transport system permease protein/sulfonate transport system permease protein
MLHDVARTSGVDGIGRLFRVTLPAALPSIATGIRISAAIGLVVCVTAEFYTGAGGVGDYMEDQRLANNIPELYAAVVLVALVGYGVNLMLRIVERRTLFWAGEERSTQ